MKKILLNALCLAVSLTVLSACGGETTSPSAESGVSASTVSSSSSAEIDTEARRTELEDAFLEKANEVVVNEDSVTFTDASSDTPITIAKNPQKVVSLYASFTTLWYEAGGEVIGCIGADTSSELYEEYIGRDITGDEGMTVVSTSSAAKNWDVESIIALQPDLIICSTAMSGYSTMQSPAAAADIPVIAVSYEDFSDYLKWFKVFCNLNDQPELWDSIAMKSLHDVVDVLLECPIEDNPPTVFSMFAGSESLQANTDKTVIGGMLTAIHARNIVDNEENITGAERLDINLEAVFAENPDILLVQCHAGMDEGRQMVEATYGDNPVWQSLQAVKDGKVYYLEKELFHNKPNSRFAEAYQKLAAILYPNTVFSFQTE